MANDIPIPKEIEVDDFEGPEKVAELFNQTMEEPMREVVPDEKVQQVLYVMDGDYSKSTKIKNLPAQYMFTLFARKVNERIENGEISPGTGRNWFTFIKTYYTDQVIKELESEASEVIKRGRDTLGPREYSGANVYWPLEKVRSFIKTEESRGDLRKHVYSAIWYMCYIHGRRIGEVLDVKWSDIEGGQITYNIEKKKEETRATLQLYEPIQRHIDFIEQKDGIEYVFHGFKNEDGDLVPINKPLSQTSVRSRFDSTAKICPDIDAGDEDTYGKDLPKYSSTKILRHSIGTIVAKNHGSKAAQSLLQHANPEITMRVYAKHIEEDDPDEVADVWEGAFS